MLYKRIADGERIIYCTEQSDIYITEAQKEGLLKERIEKQEAKLMIQPFDLDEKRTKLKKLIILLTTSCNLRCRYCYLNYGNYDKEEKIQNIDVDKAKIAIDMLLSDFPEGIGFIQFFGGEPLVAFGEMREIYNYIKQVFTERNLNLPKFGMVTNGLLLNNQIIDFLNQNKFSVTISVDGDMEIHNKVRIKTDHSDSFKHIKEKMQAFSENVSFPLFYEMTLNREHILLYSEGKIKDWLNAIKALGFKSGIVGVVEFSRDQTLDFRLEDRSVLEKIYRELVDYFFMELQKEDPQFYNLDVCKLVWMLLRKDLSDVSCAAGIYQFTLSAEGNFYPCPKFADCNTKVGSVTGQKIETEGMRTLIKEDEKEQCRNCWLHYLCKSYCYALNYRNKDNRTVIPIRCIHMNLLTTNVIRNIVHAKKNEDLDIIMRNIKKYWKEISYH